VIVTSPRRKRIENWLVVGSATAAIGVVVLAYPYAMEVASERLGIRGAALALLGLVAISMAVQGRSIMRALRGGGAPSLGIPLVLAAAAATERSVFLQLVPVFVYWTLGEVARTSLREGDSLIEQAVRYLIPEAPDFVRPYCRRLTALWSLFFFASAAGIMVLAWLGPPGWWRAFTSLWIYVAMLVVSIVEFFVRKTWFRYYFHDGPFDRLWSRLFPAEATPQGRESLEHIRRFRAENR